MIIPKCKSLDKMYITASGQVLPCCYVHKHNIDIPKWNINFNDIDSIKRDMEEWISNINSNKGDVQFDVCEYNCSKPIENQKPAYHAELTTRCVLECPRCPRTIHSGKYKVQDLPLEYIKEFVLASPHKKSDRFNMSGSYGDPIYHMKFLDVIEFLDSIEQSWWLSTNGSNKKISWWERFYNSYDDSKYSHETKNIVSFALDGLQDTNHLYRVGSDFNEVFEVMKLGVSLGKTIAWQFIPFSFNEHQIEEARKMSEDNGIVFNIRKSDRWLDRYDSGIKVEDPLRPKNDIMFFYKNR